MEKVVFLDIDGTLVDYDGTLPASARAAVQTARANGHKVFMVTGRSGAEIYPYLWEVGFDGYIGGNGVYIEANGEVIKHQVISVPDMEAAVAWLDQHDIGYYLEANSGLYASDNFIHKVAELLFGADTVANQDKFKAIMPDIIYGADMHRDDLNKISFILNTQADYTAATKAFPQFEVGHWSALGEYQEFGDFGQKGVDKANAIAEMMTALHLTADESFAFGDAETDLPMMKACTYGVAMGNSKQHIKDEADYVTAGVTEDGLAKAFTHFGLI